jgi:hypothetical protein
VTGPNGVLNVDAALSPTKLLAAWLAPIGRSGAAMRIGDPLPFRLITKIGGTDCPRVEMAEHLMSLHTLSDKTLGYEAAEENADTTHRAMTDLARWATPITMPDGTVAVVDYTDVVQVQVPIDYDEVAILRWVGRYKLCVSYIYIGSVSSS